MTNDDDDTVEGEPEPENTDDDNGRPDINDEDRSQFPLERDPELESLESPLNSDDSGRSSRATGSEDDRDLSIRACTMDDQKSGDPNELNDLISRLSGTSVESKSSDELTDKDRDLLKQLGLDDQTRTGERATNWIECDKLTDKMEHVAVALSDTFPEFAKGINDFARNYCDMREGTGPNPDADKYYHCMANCEASERGAGGIAAAALISLGREATDLYRNYTEKNMSWERNINDSWGDLKADWRGMQGGISGDRCFDICQGDWRHHL
jgi:hypothetical protein